MTLKLTVPDDLDGERLDRAVARLATGLSRARVRHAIEDGAVRVNGKRFAKGASIAKGDVITVEETEVPNPDAPATPTPDALLKVCFESEDVLVVDKPAGQPTAPLKPAEIGTLANALVGRYPELAGIGYGPREPGILHRLDKDTSGLVIVARTPIAFEALREALKDGRIEKQYLLICKSTGLPDAGTIQYPLSNHPKDQRRVYACIHPRDVMRYSPREASTVYRVQKRAGEWALVSVRVAKALRHQIRVHFAAIGHPLVADALYGGPPAAALGRHALHASAVSFRGGPSLPPFAVESPLPAELEALLT